MSIKGQGHYLTLVHGQSDLKFETFLSETFGPFESVFRLKAHGSKKMKIYSNVLDHMIKMVGMPINRKKNI